VELYYFNGYRRLIHLMTLENCAQRTRLCAGGVFVFRQPGGQAIWVNDV
jgi:hypothetical protein